MAENMGIYVGTVGEGAWRSDDGGKTFGRIANGMFIEADVRALAVDPRDPRVLYAGTNAGLYRTENRGDRWERLETPFDPGAGWPKGVTIWSLLVHPTDPDTLFVGVCPAALYRSRDRGATWELLDAGLEAACEVLVYNRVTCLIADPTDPNTVWAGAEIDAIHRSRDMGDTWEALGEGLSSRDIHALAIVPGTPMLLVASTNNDLNLSRDDGATWEPQNVKARFPWAYCRGLAQKPDDPRTLFLGNGNGPPGWMGALQVSRDGGSTWRAAELLVPPNSTIWTFAVTPALPALIAAATVSGLLYLSADAGTTWRKSPREFGEIRAVAIA